MKKIIACASLLMLVGAVYKPGQARIARQELATPTPLGAPQLASFPADLLGGDPAGVTPGQNGAVEATTPLLASTARPPLLAPELLGAGSVQAVPAQEGVRQLQATACQQLISNGGFENNLAWLTATAGGDAGYSTAYFYQGVRSAFFRSYASAQQTVANADLWQAVTIPAETTEIAMTFYSRVIRADPGETVYLSFYDETFTTHLDGALG